MSQLLPRRTSQPVDRHPVDGFTVTAPDVLTVLTFAGVAAILIVGFVTAALAAALAVALVMTVALITYLVGSYLPIERRKATIEARARARAALEARGKGEPLSITTPGRPRR